MKNINVLHTPIPNRRDKIVRKHLRLAQMNEHFKQGNEIPDSTKTEKIN